MSDLVEVEPFAVVVLVLVPAKEQKKTRRPRSISGTRGAVSLGGIAATPTGATN